MSMGSPLGINMTAQTGQAEQGIDRVNQKLEQTKIKVREASLATKDLNAEMTKNLREGAQLAKNVGYGGPFKEFSRGGGGSVLGMLGIAAAAGAAITQVITRFTDLAEESAKRMISFQDMFRAAAAKAEQARGASAESGLTQEQAYRKAMFSGGSDAIGRADALMLDNVPADVAYSAAGDTQGVASKYGYDKVHAVLVKIARRGGDVGKAAQYLKKRPWSMEGDSPADDAMGIAPENRQDARLRDYVIEWSEFPRQADKAGRLRGQKTIADRNNATAGAALPGRQKELAWATDPKAAAKQEVLDAIQKMVDDANRLAKTQGLVAKTMANFFSNEGSKEVQATRLENDAERAMDGDP